MLKPEAASGQRGRPVAEAGWYPDRERQGSLRYWDGSSWTEHRVAKQGAPARHPEPTGQVEQPSPRLIRSPRDAEEAAKDWCRWLGFADAELTGRGSDGGVDVRGRSLVAQVKAHMVPIGRPDVQKLFGVATAEGAVPLFFSLMAYTREAQVWADQYRVALFRFDHAGEAQPVNECAMVMFDRAEHQEGRPAEPLWSLPIGCSDLTAYDRLKPRRSGLRQLEQVLWVRQGWLPFASLRYDFSYVALTKGVQQDHFGSARVAIDLWDRRAIRIPQATGSMVLVPPDKITIKPLWTAAELARDVSELWINSPGFGQPAQFRHDRYALSKYGVPGAARTLQVRDEGMLLLPFFAALIRGPAGDRIAVAEGVTGQADPVLSSAFTRTAPNLLGQLNEGRQIGPT